MILNNVYQKNKNIFSVLSRGLFSYEENLFCEKEVMSGLTKAVKSS